MIVDLQTMLLRREMPTGLIGQISYGRLVEQLRKAGELREDETITHLEMRPEAIRYRVERTP